MFFQSYKHFLMGIIQPWRATGVYIPQSSGYNWLKTAVQSESSCLLLFSSITVHTESQSDFTIIIINFELLLLALVRHQKRCSIRVLRSTTARLSLCWARVNVSSASFSNVKSPLIEKETKIDAYGHNSKQTVKHYFFWYLLTIALSTNRKKYELARENTFARG